MSQHSKDGGDDLTGRT